MKGKTNTFRRRYTYIKYYVKAKVMTLGEKLVCLWLQ